MYKVGSVPYLNAKPLVRLFEDLGESSPVKVLYEVPSLLPKMLSSGLVQAIMVSSIEALRSPGRKVARGVCIGTQQDVLSVRLFSKVPPEDIQTLAQDQSSMTSNALAKIVLKENYGVSPRSEPMLPDLDAMLAEHDACILIGDNGMREQGDGLFILDLGHEWFRLTDLPFVWAMWLGDDGLTVELAQWLSKAERAGQERMDVIAADAPVHTGMSFELCNHYLRDIMYYPMGDHELDGLKEFQRLLTVHNILEDTWFPEIVG